jgi:hypothetical protein
MKILKITIRIWIALTSLAAFAAGWAALAHSPKPNQFKASQVSAIPALPPVPSLNQAMRGGEGTGITIRPRQQVQLRTGGS